LMRLINGSVYSLEIFEEHPGCLCNVVFSAVMVISTTSWRWRSMAETRACRTRRIDVIVEFPIRRIDRECKHKLWSPNMLASATVLFGPWLWGHLVVDHKKLRLGSATAKNSPIPSRVCRTAVSIAVDTLVQMPSSSSTPEKKGSFHRHRVRSHSTAKCA